MAYDLPPIAQTPRPPYYAVLFTSVRTDLGADEYADVAGRMLSLARDQPGFLGVETVRDAGGVGITLSYWTDRESIASWKANAEHRIAQTAGRETWYADYRLRIALVEADYGKNAEV